MINLSRRYKILMDIKSGKFWNFIQQGTRICLDDHFHKQNIWSNNSSFGARTLQKCARIAGLDNEQREVLRDCLYNAISSVQITDSGSQVRFFSFLDLENSSILRAAEKWSIKFVLEQSWLPGHAPLSHLLQSCGDGFIKILESY